MDGKAPSTVACGSAAKRRSLPRVSDDFPNASSFEDRHGKVRWRYRRRGKTFSLHGRPGDPEFKASYDAAIRGEKYKPPRVVAHPASTIAKSLRAGWRIVTTRTEEWKALDPASKEQQTRNAERFLERLVPETETPYGDGLVADLKRKHVKAMLADLSATPHAARQVLTILRKIITAALDEEWIEVDPTHRLKYRPTYKGWRAWTLDEREKFEAFWPLGSPPRTAYSLALYLGHRRSDVARAKWAEVMPGWASVTQQKTGRALDLPVLPQLAAALGAINDRDGTYILINAYGRPYSIKALGMRMQDWTRQAGIGPGATMHGLRKTLGKALAESGATTRELMDILGHTDIKHAELYTREAEQKVLAEAGMGKLLVGRFGRGKPNG